MKPCPRLKKKQCVIWEVSAITILVFVAVYAVVSRMYDFSATKELIISVGASFSILWCVWVVRTFRAMMMWWIQVQDKMNHALAMLEEAKNELNEIKSSVKK